MSIQVYVIMIMLSLTTMVLLDIQTSNANVFHNKIDKNTIYFGCDVTATLVHCDRSHNMLESFTIQSNSTTLYKGEAKPVYVNGREGSAIQMYANHRESIIFSNTTEVSPSHFSIAFWIKCTKLLDDTNSPDIGHIISQYNENLTSGWSFNALNLQNIKNESLSFVVYNNKGQAFSPPDVPIFRKNAFLHIVGTFDGSYVKLYRDGSFFGEAKFNGTYNSHIKFPLTLGVSSSRPLQFFGTGSLDDLRYYDRVLTTEEIKRIYSKGDPDSPSSIGLIGHWKFNGNLEDTSGNRHNGRERTLISSMAFAPDGRLFFSEKDTGYIKIMDGEKVNTKPFASITDYYSNWEQGLLGLTIDPEFEHNHFIYLFYTSMNKQEENPFNRIVRFTDVDNEGKNKVVLMDNIPASRGYHSGGAMAFGPDHKLYVTIGDATQNTGCGNMPDSVEAICPAQDSSNLLGKVLRINRDGSIPTDNPYPNSPVFNIGHLNMYGIAFDDSGLGLVSENGRFHYDEINTVEKAINYGSPTIQYPDSNPEISSNSSKPLRTYYDAKCLTSLIYYNGKKIPLLNNKFLVGTFKSSSPIYALQVDSGSKKIVGELAIFLNNSLNNQVVSMAHAPNGDLYYASYEINKLNSVDSTHRIQTFFTVEITPSSPSINITDFTFVPSKNQVRIEIDNNIDNYNLKKKYNFDTIQSAANLTIIIPNTLVKNIDNVTSTFSHTKTIQYNLANITMQDDNNTNDTAFNISFKDFGHYTLQISGNSLTSQIM